MKTLAFCTLLLVCIGASAQQTTLNLTQFIEDIFEQYTAETETSIDYENFYDDLISLSENPLNLNKAGREEMRKLRFLSDAQIENIQAYVYVHGPLNSLFELQLVDGIDLTDIRRMQPFVDIGKGSDAKNKLYLRDFLTRGKNQLLIRTGRVLEKSRAYTANETTPPVYAGNPWYQSLKYNYKMGTKLLISFTAEKDAGEPFLQKAQKGFDFYSGSVQWNNAGPFTKIVVGDYRTQFGQGLILHSGFGISKTSNSTLVSPSGSGISKSSSSNESAYFRGGAFTLKLKNTEISLFGSGKKMDADTTNNSFQSFLKTGYHRTVNERANKHTLTELMGGGNIQYRTNAFEAGITAMHVAYNKNRIPEPTLANYYAFNGKQQTIAGINYRARVRIFNLFGETAYRFSGGMATVNGCNFTPAKDVELMFVQRYYAPTYIALYAAPFSENSGAANESGFYTGLVIRPFKRWNVSAYADYYHSVWPRYLTDGPSTGTDYLLQAGYSANSKVSMYWRIRIKTKERNKHDSNSTMAILAPFTKQSLRYQLQYSTDRFNYQQTLEANRTSWDGFKNSNFGVLASVKSGYAFTTLPLQLNVACIMFDAEDYENRIYQYERDLPYSFSVPASYGRGSRYYINISYKWNTHLACWFRISQTIYADDRQTTGSGNDTLDGNKKTEIRLMASWKF